MQKTEPLIPNSYYHIYNHGVGNRNLFKEPTNYEHFIHLYNKYIEPIADTFAWALMPNHFHVLVKIKEDVIYRYSNTERLIDAVRFNEIKWQTKYFDLSACEVPESVKIPKPEKHFSHLFNSYAKYFNTKYDINGTLFQRPFKRKQIDNVNYLKRTILYIHKNPIHHGFCEHPLEYPWTSYLSCISEKSTKLQREAVMKWFNNKANFEESHNNKLTMKEFDEWLEKQ